MKNLLCVLFSCLLVGSAFYLPSCKTLFAPKADAAIMGEIKLGANLTDSLYASIIRAPFLARNYSGYQSQYKTIDSLITDVLIKDNGRKKSDDLFKIMLNVQKLFAGYKSFHEARTHLNNSQAKIFQAYMQQVWGDLIRAETSLK